jgi:hypothetical protein
MKHGSIPVRTIVELDKLLVILQVQSAVAARDERGPLHVRNGSAMRRPAPGIQNGRLT